MRKPQSNRCTERREGVTRKQNGGSQSVLRTIATGSATICSRSRKQRRPISENESRRQHAVGTACRDGRHGGGGMTPMQVIVASTKNAAEFLRMADAGMLEAGKSADFIVLDANPLDDITITRRIAAVYLRGAAVDRTKAP